MTHTRKEALEALLKKVEAGEQPQPKDFRAALEVPMQDMRYTVMPNDARAAYGGSLDAAKALHEAVLPGWDWRVEENVNGYISSIGPARAEFTPSDLGVDFDAPARAWLIAILRALIAQEDHPND